MSSYVVDCKVIENIDLPPKRRAFSPPYPFDKCPVGAGFEISVDRKAAVLSAMRRWMKQTKQDWAFAKRNSQTLVLKRMK